MWTEKRGRTGIWCAAQWNTQAGLLCRQKEERVFLPYAIANRMIEEEARTYATM